MDIPPISFEKTVRVDPKTDETLTVKAEYDPKTRGVWFGVSGRFIDLGRYIKKIFRK